MKVIKKMNPASLLISILAIASLLTSPVASAQNAQTSLESEFLMNMVLQLGGQPMDAGHTQVAPIGGGTFSGPGISGTVLPGGADWMTQISGHGGLDVRITLMTDDGAYIYLSYTGVMYESDAGTYWKITPSFQTASEKYDWLNHIVAVGQGYLEGGDFANGIFYDIFQIL
jgi:hypothetical protein